MSDLQSALPNSSPPIGWLVVSLNEVCELRNGRAYNKSELLSEGPYRVLRVGNFFTSDKWYYSDLELPGDKYCDAGDLLYAWSASFGPRIWDGEKVIYHYHIWRVDFDQALVERGFLFRWFEWDKEEIKSAHGTGSTMIHVTKGAMEKRQFPLPPLAEQRRIVEKLDALSAQSRAAATALTRIETLITHYKAAVLTLETCGLADRSRFPFIDLGDVAIDVSYGTSEKCSYERGNGIGVLRIPNIGSGRLDATDLKFAELSPKEMERLTLKAGDLLIIRSNGSVSLVGRTALVEELHEGLLYAGYLIRIRIDQARLNPRFLNYYMASSEARKEIEDKAKSTSGVNNINSKQIAALKIPLPALEEQAKIVARIEAAFAQIATLARAAAAARARIGALDRAILARAFKGKLVLQNPNDEPAGELLKRL